MNPPQLPEWDRAVHMALSDPHDTLLPSQGFAESVMAAVRSDGPAPLRFPWRRALPGWIAAVAALAGFAAACVWTLQRVPPPAPAPPLLDLDAQLAPVVHQLLAPVTLWALAALLLPVAGLWLTSRFFFTR